MNWRVARGWAVPAEAEKLGVFAAVSAAGAGDMTDDRRFGRALARRGLRARWAGGRQVHGRRVRLVRRLARSTRYPATDGFATNRPDVALRVHAADCVPVFIVDPVRRAAALVHAGWRGVEKNILTRGAAALGRAFGSRRADLRVFLGPHIRSCCYEVGPEVARRFARTPRGVLRRGRRGSDPRLFLDLAACLRHEALRAGVKASRFSAAPFCTMHDRRFFSFRRNKTAARMAAVLKLEGS